ncbi:MAG TPA: hypothetical protein VN521_07775 [Negativicutes bacterium]|nr:hypothetical protein [Negativicutes bacterium]
MAAPKLRITAENATPENTRPNPDKVYRNAGNQEARYEIKDEERIARLTGGFFLRNELVAINMDLSGGIPAGDRAYHVTAHELFHQIEYQLAGENANRAIYWLKEGTADLIAALVAEKIGYRSLDNWKQNQIDALRKAGTNASVQEILSTDMHGWTKMLEAKMDPYPMADLMVIYLMTKSKAGGYATILEYYHMLGRGLSNTAAFEQAFGLPPADMLAGFPAWLAQVSIR